MKRLLLALLLLAGVAPAASAQTFTKAFADEAKGTISANGGSVTLGQIIDSAGWGTLSFQTIGTYDGDLQVQCSVDGSTFPANSELRLTPPDSGTAVTTISDTAGVWKGDASGCKTVKAVATAWTSGSVQVFLRAAPVGGGGGSGSIDLSGGSFDGNAAASNTGSAVPAAADYIGLNNGGTLVGLSIGQQTKANSVPVAIASNQDALPVSQSGTWNVGITGTPTITGTVAATQSGTWNVTNVSGTVSLPTGASTSANQSTEITALQLIDNPVGSSTGGTAGTSSFLSGAIFNSTPPSLTNGQQASLQLDSSGALKVVGSSGTTQYAEDSAHADAQSLVIPGCVRRDTTPSSSTATAGDYATCNTDANGRMYVNSTLYDAAGAALAQDTQAQQNVAIASGTVGNATGGFRFGRSSAAEPTNVTADDKAVLPWHLRSGAYVTQLSFAGTLAATNSGGLSAAVQRVNEATDSQLSQDVAAIKTAAQLLDDDQTGMSLTNAGVTSLASTNATNVKGSPGRLLGLWLINTTTTTYYLRFYNLASAPTCSSATGFVQTIPIPPAPVSGQAGGFSFQFGPSGFAFGTGIGYCITGGSSSTDNTNADTGIFGFVGYK